MKDGELLKVKNIWGFTIVTVIVGFMLAIQFQTVKQPEIRDTRDSWELRSAILNEQEIQSKIVKEIQGLEEQIAKYETNRSTGKEAALKETLEELKHEAGLTEASGGGVIITIKPLTESELLGESVGNISPDLLKRLINELNQYNAQHISINGQRVINTTVIRDINGVTKIDGYPLNKYPIEIKVIADDAKKLHDRIQVSKVVEEFFVDNLNVEITKPINKLTIPPYQNTIRIKYMEPVEHEKGGNS